MINASNNMITYIGGNARTFKARFLVNGSELSCDILSVTVNKGAGEKLTPGSLFIPYLEAKIANCSTSLEGVDISFQIGAVINNSTEWLTIGKFTVAEVKDAQGEIKITAVGFLNSKCGGDVTIAAGTTVANAVSAINAVTGLTVTYSGITITGTITTGYTKPAREWYGIIAGMFDGSVSETNNGGIIIFKPMSGSALSVSDARCVDAPTIAESDVTEEGYTFRPGIMPLTLGDPRLEPWDYLTATIEGSTYIMPCQKTTHTFDGGLQTTVDCSRDLPQADVIKGPVEVKLDGVEVVASEAYEQAESTNKYFWFTSTDTGAGAGAHITEIPQDDFISDPTNGGGNLLARSNGIAVRDGLNELAVFGADGTQIGTADSGHTIMTDRKFQLKYGSSNIANLYVSNNAQGYETDAQWVSDPNVDGDTIVMDIHAVSITSVKYDDDTDITNYTLSADGYTVTVPSRDTTKWVIIYFVSDSPMPHYVLGTYWTGERLGQYSFHQGRKNGAGQFASAMGYGNRARGKSSHAEGEGNLITLDGFRAHAEGYGNTVTANDAHAEGDSNTVSGLNAHAEGYGNTVSGQNAHAENGQNVASGNASHAGGYKTIAQGDSQTVIGNYNVAQGTQDGWLPTDYAFIIGNGTAENSRSNAFAVTWGGDVYLNSNKLADYIIEEGTKSGSASGPFSDTVTWYYRKWKSGKVEAWGVAQGSCAINNSDGGGYRTAWLTVSIPSGIFSSQPRVWCNAYNAATTSAIGSVVGGSAPSSTSTGSWAMYRITSVSTSQTRVFEFYCKQE